MQPGSSVETVLLTKLLDDLDKEKTQTRAQFKDLDDQLNAVKSDLHSQLANIEAKKEESQRNVIELESTLKTVKAENQKALAKLRSEFLAELKQRPVPHTEEGCEVARNSSTWDQGVKSLRHKVIHVTFKEPYVNIPFVHVGFTLIDEEGKRNTRVQVSVRDVTKTGFQLVFTSWGDSHAHALEAHWLSTV